MSVRKAGGFNHLVDAGFCRIGVALDIGTHNRLFLDGFGGAFGAVCNFLNRTVADINTVFVHVMFYFCQICKTVKLYNNHTSDKYRLSKENRQKTDFVDYLPKNSFKSSSTVPIPAMPNVSVRIFATFGERNAGRVGPRWIFFTPSANSASSTITAFCSYHAML